MTKLLIALFLTFFAFNSYAQVSDPNRYAELEHKTKLDVENKLAQLLEKYCRNSCLLLGTDVEIDEQIDSIEDIGFEGIDDSTSTKSSYFVSGISVKVQIDDRVSTDNRDKLEKIIKYNLQNYGKFTSVEFFDLSVPDIGSSVSAKERAVSTIKGSLKAIVEGVVQKYCPDTCLLSDINVLGTLVSADQAEQEGIGRFVHDRSSGQYLRIDDASIKVAFSQAMGEAERTKVEELISIKAKQYPNVSLARSVVPFPETYSERKAKEEAESADPYGLDKLKKTLNLFKELSTNEDIATTEEAGANRNLIIGGVLGLIALIIIGLFMRYSAIQKETALMKQAADYQNQQDQADKDDEKEEQRAKDEAVENKKLEEERDLLFKLKSDYLIEELTKIFFKVPKVAKETFGKMIEEEGVEQTSKYVHILGKTVVFELLNDPNYRRSLRELSEYYHKTEFEFSPEEEYKLLANLKTKVTANEIRVASRKSIEAFEFLSKLDVEQIYTLVNDETERVQSVVLSQLPSKKRQRVFELFEGNAKTSLMTELCKADTIPRDYLINVGKTLSKKMTSSAEYDTENLRSNDVLLDLLEKSQLSEQRELINELEKTNGDAARAIKHKLVTVHMLKYIKTGHLLEIILGLDQEELVAFLSGSPEDVSQLLIRQAPEELSESWREELANIHGVDETKYRMIEIKILNRVKSLAAAGAIHIGEINDMIFSEQSPDSDLAIPDSPEKTIEIAS
jgi:flagellar motor switch protein FliG/type II secretory pathway pseudopilin PulG